jgi:hypothetical protein
MRIAGYVTLMDEMRSTYRIVVGKLELEYHLQSVSVD